MVQRLVDRLRRMPNGIVWLLGAMPLALLVWDTVTGRLGVDPVRDIEHRLGRTALYFVVGSLCFTPALRLFRINLVKFRRPVGLVAFTYAALYLINKVTRVKVSFAHQEVGLDESLHGESAYL